MKIIALILTIIFTISGFTSDYIGNNSTFLRISPDRESLEYRKGETAKFVIFNDAEVSSLVYEVFSKGYFPENNREIELSKIGNVFYFETEVLGRQRKSPLNTLTKAS